MLVIRKRHRRNRKDGHKQKHTPQHPAPGSFSATLYNSQHIIHNPDAFKKNRHLQLDAFKYMQNHSLWRSAKTKSGQKPLLCQYFFHRHFLHGICCPRFFPHFHLIHLYPLIFCSHSDNRSDAIVCFFIRHHRLHRPDNFLPVYDNVWHSAP